jgi:hypothetical protein
MTLPTPRLILAMTHLLLAVTFVGGAILAATHREPRDKDMFDVGVVLMVSAASLIFVRHGIAEFMAVARSNR